MLRVFTLTNLGRRQTLLAKLEYVFLDVLRSQLQPGGDAAAVRQRRLGDTLAGIKKNTRSHNLKFIHLPDNR